MGTCAELGQIPQVKERQGLAADAIALAQVMDDPTQVNARATNSRQKQALLKELREGRKRKLAPRLAQVQAMSRRARAQ